MILCLAAASFPFIIQRSYFIVDRCYPGP